MKSLAEISNDILHTLTLTAAQNEKSATLLLLEHLAEIDRRRLYAEKGFPSLWVYVHEFLGYSESQTSERVSAMRLMMKFPEVKKELEEGKISLTSTAKLATHVRREKTGNPETLELLHAISGKTSRDVDQLLAQKSKVEFQMEKFKIITHETTRMILDVDSEFLTLLNRVRELKGHAASTTQELLKTSLKGMVEKHEAKPGKPVPLRAREVEPPPAKPSTPPINTRYIPSWIRNQIRLRSGDQCEYVDTQSQRRCSCKTRLEFDHIVPFALGGKTSYENLRHYCPAHNQLAAIREFGSAHMSQFLKN